MASKHQDYVYRLKKAIYGLKQAPRAWFGKLRSTFLQLGFHQSKADVSLFFNISSFYVIYILIYVDDIILTESNPIEIQQLIKLLDSSFSLKDLSVLHPFLGIGVTQLANGHLFFNQHKYIMDFFWPRKLLDAKPCSTLMYIVVSLSANDGELFDNLTLYISVIGSLQYATITRPDLAFVVNKVY